MSTSTPTVAAPRRTNDDAVARWLPLAGAGFGISQIAGNLIIDQFPDESTSKTALIRYYATHHAQVQRGGTVLALGCVFLGLFVAGLVVRSRHHFGAAAVIAVGGAAMLATEVASGSTYALLGRIGHLSKVDPAALQAWHISGAGFGIGVATSVFLIGVALSGIFGDVVPRWIAWTALLLGLGVITPIGNLGFLFSMLTLLWSLVAGLVLAARPRATE